MSEEMPVTGMEINPELVPPDPIQLPAPIRIFHETDVINILGITKDELTEMSKRYNVWVCGGENYYRAEDLQSCQIDRFMRNVSPGDSSEG